MKNLGFLLFLLVVPFFSVYGQDASVAAEGIDWTPFSEALDAAQKSEKILLIDIYAPWCRYCRQLQREVYTDERVREYVNTTFIVTRLNGDDAEEMHQFKEYSLTGQELAMALGAQGFPTTVFLRANSEYITRLPGFAPADDFFQVLQYIGTEAYLEGSYQDYVQTLNK